MTDERAPSQTARIGFYVGLIGGVLIILGSAVFALPEGLSSAGVRTIGVTWIVGVWWITEALPLGATALLPVALFPLLGITTGKQVAPAYMSWFIMLLLGGFLLAKAVERSGVHRRLALHVLLRVGTSPHRLILGFAIAGAVLSMWISNTATTLIMMPVVLAIVDRAKELEGERAASFSLAVLLGTGYGSSVGGMGTPIGTPPNIIAIGALQANFPNGPEFSFVSWAAAAVPVVAIIIPIIWVMLTRVAIKVPKDLNLGAEDVIRTELEEMGAWRKIEVRSLLVFGLAAVLWITRKGFTLGTVHLPGWAEVTGIGKAADDGTVAILCAMIAFIIPSGDDNGSRLLPWSTAVKVPWDLVLLFGGGVALSTGFNATGLSEYLGSILAGFGESSLPVFVAVITLSTTFLTEIMSNTALSNIAMPILASVSKSLAIDPRVLLFPCALAASCAFMMPAATGPNAIVFGTGRIRIGQMVRVGFWINLLAFVVITIISALIYG